MTKKSVPLTPQLLRTIIEEEVGKFGDEDDVGKRSKQTKETDADEYADSVEKPVDWKKANHIKEVSTIDQHVNLMKTLKIEEARLVKRLGIVRRALSEGAQQLVRAKVV